MYGMTVIFHIHTYYNLANCKFTHVQYCSARHLILLPDPTLKEGKGLVYIERFLGLDDVAFLNFHAPIRFMPCGLHRMYVGAVDALPYQNDVYDMLQSACPRNCSMYTRPFRWSLGMRLVSRASPFRDMGVPAIALMCIAKLGN